MLTRYLEANETIIKYIKSAREAERPVPRGESPPAPGTSRPGTPAGPGESPADPSSMAADGTSVSDEALIKSRVSQRVRAHVKLIVDPTGEGSLADALRHTPACQMLNARIGVMFDASS